MATEHSESVIQAACLMAGVLMGEAHAGAEVAVRVAGADVSVERGNAMRWRAVVGASGLREDTPDIHVFDRRTGQPAAVSAELGALVNVDWDGLSLFERICANAAARHSDPPEEHLRYVGSVGNAKAAWSVGFRLAYDLAAFRLISTGAEHIADLGCGYGRFAVPVLQLLEPEGRYTGFDTWKDGIEWGRGAIGGIDPRARFSWLETAQTNRGGYDAGTAVALDLADASVDVVTCHSLFTHLQPEVTLAYLGEIHRVLKPGGACLATFFVARPEDLPPLLARLGQFRDPVEQNDFGVFVRDGAYAETYLAVDAFEEAIGECGMTAEVMRYGHWRSPTGDAGRRRGFDSYQDMVILRA